MPFYSVCQLQSGGWLHAQCLPHQALRDSDCVNVIGVEATDHIDAYIQAKVPVEDIHEIYQDEVKARLKENGN